MKEVKKGDFSGLWEITAIISKNIGLPNEKKNILTYPIGDCNLTQTGNQSTRPPV